MANDPDVRARREQIVREHMDAENRLDFEAALATFTHPRYELVGLGRVIDGADEVRQYFVDSRTPFPDQRNELIAMHHADDAVIVEFWLLGTHLGPIFDEEPTGRAFRVQMAAIFVFEGVGLVCERVYFNPGDLLAQISG